MENQVSKVRGKLIGIAFGIFAVIVFGLLWLFLISSGERSGFGWYLFSFATGLTMIVLPCTLPLAFVIVPLSMGKGVRKGLGIALSFGVGVAITLSLYGIAAAVVGKTAIGSLGAPLEVVKNWVYFIAGIFAYLFALGEIGLIKLRMPSYTGAAPAFIQKQGDFLKALMLGLFLGNIGVGCPHPATPLLLVEIATSGNVFYGWTLFLTHAIGRILPLLLLAILGIAGVNGLSWLVARKDRIERATGWAMVFVAGFILILGLFTHDWWVNSGIHTRLEKITQEETLLNILGAKFGTGNLHHHGVEMGKGLFGLPLTLGNWFIVALWLIPIWWWWKKEKRRVVELPDTAMVSEKVEEKKTLNAKRWGFVAVSALLALVFIYILPHNFLKHEVPQGVSEGAAMENTAEHGALMEGMNMADTRTHAGTFHEEADVKDGFVVTMKAEPVSPIVGEEVRIEFLANMRPSGAVVDDLQIEHTKLIHVIGVRSDLTNFLHIHPQKVGPGQFVIDGIFSEPGSYKLWSDVTRAGTTHSFGYSLITVREKDGGVRQEEKPLISFETVTNVDGYSVEFVSQNPFVSGRSASLGFNVKDSFAQVVTFEPYLGADMHLTAIKSDLSEYIHTHPAGHEMQQGSIEKSFSLAPIAYANGDEADEHDETMMQAGVEMSSAQVPFDVTFPTAGVYKLFAQFRPQGISLPPDASLVAEFFVKAEEKSSIFGSLGTGGRAPVSRAVLVVISLILMAILSLGVKKYLGV